MDKELQKEMDECHFWILPKGTIIRYGGMPYYLKEDTEILGNNVPKEFIPPSNEDIRRFLEG